MAIIIETCPKCGHDLHDLVIATYPPIPRKECWSCGWSWEGEPEEVIRMPFGGNGLKLDEYTSLNCIVDEITEKEIQEHLASSINTINTIAVDYAKNSVLG